MPGGTATLSVAKSLVARPRRIAIAAAIVLALVLLLLAAFPIGLFKGFAERRLSAHYGRPVTIATLSRLDPISFSPRLRVEGLRIPQAPWAGRGDMLRIARLDVRLPVLPLLVGRVRPNDIRIDGLDATLVRASDGRVEAPIALVVHIAQTAGAYARQRRWRPALRFAPVAPALAAIAGAHEGRVEAVDADIIRPNPA
ncbi:MAG: AsmA family protein, partial [Oxalobacteraceae bacterium]